MSSIGLLDRPVIEASAGVWPIVLSGDDPAVPRWLIAPADGPRRVARELLNSQFSQTMGSSGGRLPTATWKIALIGGALLLLQPQVLPPLQWTRDDVVQGPASARHPSRSPHQDALAWIKNATGLANARIAELIGVTRQTVHNWSTGSPIEDPNYRQLLTVRDILERAQRRHPTPEQLRTWLDTPRGADAVTPAQLIAAGDFNKARLYAVSMPSPAVRPPTTGVRRAVTGRRPELEMRDEPIPPDTSDEDIEQAIQAARQVRVART